jgi:hypothetical protein
VIHGTFRLGSSVHRAEVRLSKAPLLTWLVHGASMRKTVVVFILLLGGAIPSFACASDGLGGASFDPTEYGGPTLDQIQNGVTETLTDYFKSQPNKGFTNFVKKNMMNVSVDVAYKYSKMVERVLERLYEDKDFVNKTPGYATGKGNDAQRARDHLNELDQQRKERRNKR